MKSSIIDVPRQHTQDDLFGINIYQNALIKYVKLTETPITIALQGEWGSGKTSLMNLLKWHLCDEDNAPYFPIWINTWQYSLMKKPEEAIISILEGIINQIGVLNPNKQTWDESKKKIGKIFGKLAKAGTRMAVNAIGVNSGIVDEVADVFASDEEVHSDIVQLKNEISDLILNALQHNPQKQGFTFYIDDLDRIDPPVAVEILELLKNIFDLQYCVFILAIDYDVVIKGLKPKFGELTDKNEREFRSFFDKIIQLPFSMPVASYNIDTFLVDALQKIEFFTSNELNDAKLTEDLSEIAQLSVGTNPRSLKRLTNTLSLISIINADMANEMPNDTHSKLINFALVCMQIAYPYVYNQLVQEPDFKTWDESIASKLKLRPMTHEERESLDAADEFDEDWEKVLFRMCQKETHLSNRVFQVSKLLNKLASIINNKMLGETIEAIIQMSAVTNLKAFDSAPRLGKRNRDLSNYRFNGNVYSKKVALIRDVILYHLSLHPEYTLEQLQDDFRVAKNMNSYFLDFEEFNKKQKDGYYNFFRCKKEEDLIHLANTSMVLSSNWPTTVNGTPGIFLTFLDVAKKLGYQIVPCEK